MTVLSMSDEILARIESSGTGGVKKADLKKAFGKETDGVIEKLREQETIFVDKKGVAYFVWTKDNYVSHLTENDPKFKIIMNMVLGLSRTVGRLKEQTYNLLEDVEQTALRNTVRDDVGFESMFNKWLNRDCTSIGWAPFSKIRENMCEKHNLSKEKFYALANDLIERHPEKYELSSGGGEGIMIRGIIHGFVRNI